MPTPWKRKKKMIPPLTNGAKPYDVYKLPDLTPEQAKDALDLLSQLPYCPGPKRTSGAISGPILKPRIYGSYSEVHHPAGSTAPENVEWVDNPAQPVMEFCEHGYQYSHYIRPEDRK